MAEHGDLMQAIGRLEGKVDAIGTDMASVKVATTERLNVHSTRLGSLERSRAKAYGGAGVLGLLVTAVLGLTWWE